MRTKLDAMALANSARDLIKWIARKTTTINAAITEWNICVDQSGFTGLYDFPTEGYTRKAQVVADLERCAAQLDSYDEQPAVDPLTREDLEQAIADADTPAEEAERLEALRTFDAQQVAPLPEVDPATVARMDPGTRAAYELHKHVASGGELPKAPRRMFEMMHEAVDAVIELRPSRAWLWQSCSNPNNFHLLGWIVEDGTRRARLECTPRGGAFWWRNESDGERGEQFATVPDAVRDYFGRVEAQELRKVARELRADGLHDTAQQFERQAEKLDPRKYNAAQLAEYESYFNSLAKGEESLTIAEYFQALEPRREYASHQEIVQERIAQLDAAPRVYESRQAALDSGDFNHGAMSGSMLETAIKRGEVRIEPKQDSPLDTFKPYEMRRVTITGVDRVNLYLDGDKVGTITATPSTVWNGRPKDDPAVVTLNGARHEFDTETAAIDWARAQLKALTASADEQNAAIMESGGRKALAGIAAAVDALMCVDHDRHPAARQAINQLEDVAQLLTVKQEDAPALKPFTVWIADQISGDNGYADRPFICHIDAVNAAAIEVEALSVYRESFGLPREGWLEFCAENGAYVFQVIAGHIPFLSIVNNYDGLGDDDAAYIWDIAK